MTYEEIVEESKRIRGQWSVPDEVRDKAAKELEVGQWPDDEDTAKTIRTAPKEDFEKAVSERQGRMADVTKARQTEQTLKDEDSLLGKVKSAFSSKPAEPPSAPVPLAVEPAQTPSPITLTPSPIRAPQQRASPPPVPAPPQMAHTLKPGKLPPPSPNDIPESRLLASAMNRDDRMAVADSLYRVIRKRSDLPTLENDLRQVYGKYLQGEQLEKAVTGTMTVAKKAQLHRAKPDELSPIATLAEQYKKKFPQEAAPKVGPDKPVSAPVPGLPEYARAPMPEPAVNYDLPEDALTTESDPDTVIAESRSAPAQSQVAENVPEMTLPEVTVTPQDNQPDWLRPAEPPPSIPNVPLQFTDKAGAPLREQAQPMGNTIGQNLTEITNNYMQGVGEIPASALRAVAEASATLDKFLPEAMKNPATVEERMAYKMGETVTRLAKEAFPTDPARQKEFLVAVLPRALGSMTGFLIGGVAGAVAEAPVATTMVLGALAGGDEGYQDAKKSGADEGTKEKAFWMNAGVGTSEAVPIGHMLGRFNQATGGRFLHALKTGGIAAAEEFLQEFFQTTAGNVIAKDILEYDKQRNRLEGAGEAGEAGGAAGWIMGLITGAIGGKRAKAQHEQAETPAQAVDRPAAQGAPVPIIHERQVIRKTVDHRARQVATEAAELTPETLEIKKGQPYRIPQERPQAVEAPVPVERPQAVEAPVPVERPKPETRPAVIETKASETETKGSVTENPRPFHLLPEEEQIQRVREENTTEPVQLPDGRYGYPESAPESRSEVAPAAESAPVPVEAEAPKTQTFELNFQEGERVTYESKGKPVTGTIVGFDNDELTVQVDQITKPGGVPIKRKEYVKITNPTLKRLDAPRLIEDSAPVPLETAAHEAATSPQNDLPEPTEAQKEAGNYQKGHVKIAGLDISIENPQGSTRSGTDASGKPWSVEMQSHYGYIKGTVGKDKDHIDVFVKPGTPEAYNGPVFVVDQVDPKTGKFDEHKAILGAVDIDEAKKMYRENYAKDWKGLGTISATPMREFRDWLNRGNTKKPFHQSKESTVLTPEAPAKLPADLIKPAPSKTPRPDRARDIDMAEQEQRPEAAVSPEGQSFIDRFKSKGFIYGTVKSGDADRLALLLDAYKLPYEGSGKRKITFKHLPGKPFKLGGYHVSDRADAVPTKAEEAAPVPVSSDVKENPANITKAEESPKTPLETTPAKGTTIEATPQKEATREPEQPRLEDARSPKEVSAQDVPGVEAGRESEPVPVKSAGADRPATRRPGKQRDGSLQRNGDAAGSNLPASGGGSADAGATDTAVSRPAKPKAKTEKPAEPEAPAGTDFRLTPEYSIPKGHKTKYKANVAAITLLKQIEHEGRLATPAEQETLAQYTGWGGLPQAFQWSRDWDTEYSELSDLLTKEEYAAARASTPNAHYTDPSTIRAMYEGLKHLGFKSGKLLEPGAGIGHFLGSIPGDLRSKVQKTAIEMDSLSARIMAQLYQRANVLHSPYQETVLPENFFDVAIGNVPFANVQVFDPHSKELSKLKLSLHDYYFAKAISQVRHGGLVAFITSRYTLDKLNGKLRDFIARKTDFVGAIRLPNTQFKEIANTDVVTDIIVLQRREDGTPAKGEPWAETKTIQVDGRDVSVNEYYAAHPEQMLGKPALAGTMYRDNEFTIEPDGRNMEAAITEAFQRMPEKIMRPRNAPASTSPRGLLAALEASDDVKDGAYTIQNNALYLRRGAQFVPVEDVTPNNLERAKGLIQLREQTRVVFKSQLAENSDAFMKKVREDLNHLYDRFVKKFGPVSGRLNKALFREDPDYPTLQALERKYDPKTNTAQKADIFKKRVIEFKPRPERAESPKDAMLASMNETGGLDWQRMSELTGSTEEELQKALKGVVYKNPSGGWEPADAYLSGNVRKKLKEAEAAAKLDPTYKEHVEALKTVIPEDLQPSQIDVKIGHGWIPTGVYEEFIDHLFDVSGSAVKYNAQVGAFAVNARVYHGNAKNDTVWGTSRYSGMAILEDSLHSKLPTVKDKTSDDKLVVNEKETLAAREKQSKMQEEFRSWMWKDPIRAKVLARLYNDEFNSVRLRDYNGDHLSLPGQNPAITLQKHQKDVIWRALQSGNTLLAHVVGAGKTFEMIGIAMEARRLRMANKPMFVVPNHLVEQWRDSILTLYPAAKVLTTTKDDFKKENRRILSGRIATGDWDAVLISHSQMSRLPVSLERFQAFAEEQIAILDDYLHELKAERGGKQANRNLTKELEKAKQRLEAKLKARQAAVAEKADHGVNFEETGVDMLLVDEADLFKNLWFPTRMTRVAGLPNTESQRSYDMFLKTQYLNKLTNQRGVIFATGTPVSNSMAEVFTMQRYLQPQLLDESGLQHFDAWARQYGNTVTSMELAPDGSGYRPRSRFAEFVNVPELTQQFRQVMDVKSQDDLKLPVPKLKTGKPINNTYKPSPALIEYTKGLIERAKNLKNADPRQDNMLKITGDGRNAALDIRLRVPGAPEDKSGKIVGMVNNVSEIYKRTADVKGTQLIFLDLSTPKAETAPKETDSEAAPTDEEVEVGDEASLRGSVYSEIKKKLIKKGIPEKEIAFIHDADTDTKKSKLFAAVNSGAVRVLIGSTEKMGAGTNVQERMVALHNLDAPWRPRDIEQRNGRGIRQGNKLYQEDPEGFQFEVHNYATEAPSFDVYMWQTLESKAKTITQIMKGDPNIRTIQDVDTNVLSYAEMKAIASGNPMILERVKVDTELKKLTLLKAQFHDSKLRMKFDLQAIPKEITFQEGLIKALEKDMATLEKHPAEPFSMVVDKKTFDEPEAAGKAILKVIEDYIQDHPKRTETGIFQVGHYRGYPMTVKMFLDNDSLVSIAGLDSSTFPPDVSAAGLVTRIGNVLESIPKRIKLAQDKIAQSGKRAAEVQDQMNVPYEHEDKIASLQARLAQIDKALDLTNKDEGVVAAPDETAKPDSPIDILKSQRGSIPLGALVPALKKKPADVVVGATGPVTFADPASEKRFQLAKQGVKPETFVQRVKDGINEIRKQTREFPELPDVPEYSQLRTSLLTLQKMKGIAADRTIRQLKSIIGDFGPNKMDVFTRKVLLDDLVREAEDGRSLPFGLTKDSVEQERDKVDALLAQNPDIADAVDQRKTAWRGVKSRYQVAMRSIGLDKLADRLSKEDYFRHQVLEYANERRQHPAGAGKELKSPTGRGFNRQRHGSERDINANYLQADFEVMAQMEHDIAVAKTIRLVDKEHNIASDLKKAAKQANTLEVEKRIAGNLQLEEKWADFKKRIGMGMSKVREALGLNKQAILSFDQLKEYAEQEGHPAQGGALMAFKAMSERRQWIKEFLGKDFQTWEDRIPEGYQVWQPEPGNVFFMAETIPHRLARQLTEALVPSLNISAEQLRAVMATGSPKEQYVIPDEVYHTLKAMAQPIPPIWQRTIRQVQGHWKQVMLLAPRRFLRYNLRNLTGDADAVFAGNPSAMKTLPKAMHDLWPVFFGKEAPLTGEVKEWFDRGGFQTTLQVQEMGDLNELKLFRDSLEREQKGGLLSIPARIFNGYWKNARLATDYREAMLRYANYLNYLEQMRGNANQRPNNFGASIRENVMALPDLRDRAFKLSNELLGAYDRVSAIGQNLRNYWYPFFSWVEVNFRRYKQMIKNAFKDISPGKASRLIGVGAFAGTLKATKWLLRFSAMWAALQAWNYLMFPDDEDELDEATRNRPHILFGRSDDGKIRYLSGIGAMGDLLSWFGLDVAPAVTRDVLNGKMTVPEALKQMAKAPVNKLVQGVTPLVKTPAELIARESTYPDIFHPRPIQDRGEYLAQQLTLSKEYGKLKGKPQQPDDFAGLVIQRQDPGSAAYTDWSGIESRFLEKIGKERGIRFRSPRSEALRNVSRAIQQKDAEAEAYWREKYVELGGTKKGMEASVRALAPLYGMSRVERDQLLATLDAADRKILKRAETYYKEKLTQVLPDWERSKLLRKLASKGWLSKEEADVPSFLNPEVPASDSSLGLAAD